MSTHRVVRLLVILVIGGFIGSVAYNLVSAELQVPLQKSLGSWYWPFLAGTCVVCLIATGYLVWPGLQSSAQKPAIGELSKRWVVIAEIVDVELEKAVATGNDMCRGNRTSSSLVALGPSVFTAHDVKLFHAEQPSLGTAIGRYRQARRLAEVAQQNIMINENWRSKRRLSASGCRLVGAAQQVQLLLLKR